jgi:hypothetical protein
MILTTNHQKTAVGAFLCSILIAVSGSANAQSTCMSEIDAARSVLNDGTKIVAKHNQDQTLVSLNSKLDDADTKLGDDKFCDARRKIEQFRDKVWLLQNKGKIEAVSPGSEEVITICMGLNQDDFVNCLIGAAEEAWACIDSEISLNMISCPGASGKPAKNPKS